MTSLELQSNFWFYWASFCGIIMTGYFSAASSLYWLMYSNGKNRISEGISGAQAEIAQHRRKSMIKDDIKLSVASVTIFSLGAALFMHFYDLGLTRVYLGWTPIDLGYIAFSYLFVLILQDTCFYFMHRLFHLPRLFACSHQGHHQSRPPTPWTFLALEPIEAIGQMGLLLGITFILPLHLGVLVAVLITMTVWSMGNHLGLKIVSRSRNSRWWGQWFIGSSHHLVHHQRYSLHYGLYFTFWDKLLDTQDHSYESQRQQLSPNS
ncbi:MAG: sterol desaturase family protein [Synechococcales cyanobacterium RM1_1_8]|nr:sterol desaturase family protein [Synechococcales cyanobacterium RM1_1_8]